MKNVLMAVLVALAVPAVAWAEQGGEIRGVGSDPIKMYVATENRASPSPFGPNVLILGFKLYANDAGDDCTLYDAATVGDDTTVIDEWNEATDEETNIHIWPFPYKLVTDLSIATNGICIVYYQ